MNRIRRTGARAASWLPLLTAPVLLWSLFNDGGGEGGEGEAGAGEGAAGGSGAAGAAEEGGTPKSFSQADVDRIVRERLARAKAEPPSDYEDLKAKAAKLDEIEAASKTELEKAQEAARVAAEREKAALDRANVALRRSAVVAAAVKAKAVDPDAVFALVDPSQVTIGDDGQVTGAEDAVKALLEAKPYLVGSTQSAGSADGGARGGAPAHSASLEDAVNRRLAST